MNMHTAPVMVLRTSFFVSHAGDSVKGTPGEMSLSQSKAAGRVHGEVPPSLSRRVAASSDGIGTGAQGFFSRAQNPFAEGGGVDTGKCEDLIFMLRIALRCDLDIRRGTDSLMTISQTMIPLRLKRSDGTSRVCPDLFRAPYRAAGAEDASRHGHVLAGVRVAGDAEIEEWRTRRSFRPSCCSVSGRGE